MSKLDDICYRMYETSGNSKYIRAEWVGKPFHPDEAKQQIKELVLELIGNTEGYITIETKRQLRQKVEEL